MHASYFNNVLNRGIIFSETSSITHGVRSCESYNQIFSDEFESIKAKASEITHALSADVYLLPFRRNIRQACAADKYVEVGKIIQSMF